VTSAFYIAFEGIEGCGKSTQSRSLVESLRADGLTVTATRETGGTDIGLRIRDVLHDTANTHLDPVAEALLIAGDRAQHRAEVLAPALVRGEHVVTLAYQGYGRQLPLSTVRAVNDWALDSRWPDLVVLLDVPHDHAMSRLAHRDLDRFERENDDFFRRVRDGFHHMASEDPSRWCVIDGTGDPASIASIVRDAVRERLGI
jgi:dTMP kinase